MINLEKQRGGLFENAALQLTTYSRRKRKALRRHSLPNTIFSRKFSAIFNY